MTKSAHKVTVDSGVRFPALLRNEQLIKQVQDQEDAKSHLALRLGSRVAKHSVEIFSLRGQDQSEEYRGLFASSASVDQLMDILYHGYSPSMKLLPQQLRSVRWIPHFHISILEAIDDVGDIEVWLSLECFDEARVVFAVDDRGEGSR